MPDPFSRSVLVYRWITFGLAAFYTLHTLITGPYTGTGGPFRYLTVWALLLSFYSASRMLAYSEHRLDDHYDVVPSVAAVLNAMVVYLYWSLFFGDPASVQSNGPIVWWREYYLHLVGPLLQWGDALFIRRAFRAPLKAAAGLLIVIVAYVAWAELFVGPLNQRPVGTVTEGLPYPFLNNMALADRLVYYATIGVAAMLVLTVFAGLAYAWRRMRSV